MKLVSSAAFAVVVLAGCTQAAPEAPAPVNVELGYAMPAINPLIYTSTDSVVFDIQMAPGQSMRQSMGQESRVRLSFSPVMGTPGNLSVAAEFEDFAGFTDNSMAGRQEMGLDAVAGEFELVLTPEGEVEVVEMPEIASQLMQMNMGSRQFEEFFVRLPAEIVHPGDSWTDTIIDVTENEIPATNSSTTTNSMTIVTSTFVGDTIVAGRTIWVIESEKKSTLLVEGETQGMAMRNDLAGNAVETTWWDPQRKVMVASVASGAMAGTISMPAAGMGEIPMSATMTRTVKLVEPRD